jgi:hypothetical protein
MRDLGQILFVFGIVFTVMGIPLALRVGKVAGAVGPVLMVIGGLMWLA